MMRKNKLPPFRHEFVMLRRLFEELKESGAIERHKLSRYREYLDTITYQFFVGSVVPRPDLTFDMKELRWKKLHVIKRSKHDRGKSDK